MKQIITMNRFTKISSRIKTGAILKQSRDSSGSVGATLTEILMALMVMGIGLVSVASLFPVSMLRSAQATKLTNGVLLKLQCEEYIQALPKLARNNYNTTYPTYNQSVYPDELDNQLGNVEFTPRSVAWPRHVIANLGELRSNLPINLVAVIDPLGASFNSVADALSYGKDPYNLHTIGNAAFTVDRKNSGFNLANATQKNLAFSMFGSNDSWKPYLSSIEVTRNSSSEVTLSDVSGADIAEFFTAVKSGSPGRIVLVDINGKQSHASLMNYGISPLSDPLPYSSTQIVPFSSPLPNNGLFNAISEVRLELFEPRYTCMITLRKQLVSLGANGQPGREGWDDDNSDGDNDPYTDDDTGPNGGLREVGWPGSDDVVRILGGDLVVFFRRDFSPLAEQVYGVENLNKGQVGIQPQEVRIRWDGDVADAKPRIRQGGYVFDTRNGYWYQIRTVIEEDRAVPPGRLGATPWIANSNGREAAVILDRSPEATGQFLMVPENIVEVFEFTSF